MENEQKKIVLPKELQIKMLKFFVKTSVINKKKKEQEKNNKSTI